ncbi:hypothetical protein TNCV_4340111 [Trichonephila clavipes]|nr:hypothetical protein TNCV_4340111 [Trichonephila clavipes]
MDVCKCIVLLQHPGTLNNCQAASPLVRLVEREGKWMASDYSRVILSLNWGGTEPNDTVTSMVLKSYS